MAKQRADSPEQIWKKLTPSMRVTLLEDALGEREWRQRVPSRSWEDLGLKQYKSSEYPAWSSGSARHALGRRGLLVIGEPVVAPKTGPGWHTPRHLSDKGQELLAWVLSQISKENPMPRRRNQSNIFSVTVSPNWHPHTLDLSSATKSLETTVGDLKSGRDASVFGGLADPYVFEFEAIKKKVYGDGGDLEGLALAAQAIDESDLDEADKAKIWKQILDADDEDFYELAEELLAEFGD